MIDLRDESRFTFEACESIRIVREGGRQNLDGDFAPEPRIARPVNLAHAAVTEQGNDLIVPEPVARGQRHRRRPLSITGSLSSRVPWDASVHRIEASARIVRISSGVKVNAPRAAFSTCALSQLPRIRPRSECH